MGSSWCPKCGADLVPPGPYDSDWRCSRHGRVLPLATFERIDRAAVAHVRDHSEVPVWLPTPLPAGWELAGLAAVGDDRSRYRATATAFRGPAPLGGEGEWLVVAEEPGVGLGSGYVAREQSTLPVPGDGPPSAKIHADGHPTPLWPVLDTGPGRSAYVGEASGVWFWLIAFPSDAGYAVFDDLAVADLRHHELPETGSAVVSQRLRPA